MAARELKPAKECVTLVQQARPEQWMMLNGALA